jgi:septal ring factor EnvC (AmiA/AmiB activator)
MADGGALGWVVAVGGLMFTSAGGMAGLWAWLQKREDVRGARATAEAAAQARAVSTPAEIAEADAKLVESAAAFVASLTAHSAARDKRLDVFETALADCEKHRDACDAQVAELGAELETSRLERAELHARIDDLMSGQVALPFDRPPR